MAANCCRCSCIARGRKPRVALAILTGVERRKMTSAASLVKELNDYNFTAVPRPGCLTLDTEMRSAETTAREIIGHFGSHGAETLTCKDTARLPGRCGRRTATL